MIFDYRLFELYAEKKRDQKKAVPWVIKALIWLFKFPLTAWILTPIEWTLSVLFNLRIPLYQDLIYIFMTQIPGQPFFLGNYLRAIYYKGQLKSMGKNVLIEEGVRISSPQNIEIDEFVLIDKGTRIELGSLRIGHHSHICVGVSMLGSGSVDIGNYCAVSHGAMLITSTESPKGGARMASTMVSFKERHVQVAPIIIKNEAFVGARATLMPGVTVEEGGVIGAGVLAFHGTKAWEIKYGRIPENLITKSREQLKRGES